MIDKIPDNILMEKELTDEQKRIFIEQINRFDELNNNYRNIANPFVDESGTVILKKGTIIHGTSRYDENILDSMSKSGILTGQAVGVSEDGETYYCADFHRVDADVSVNDYSKKFKYNDGRCPFGERRADNSSSVAFVITPNENNKELLSYDCYRDGTLNSEITRSFINYMPLSDKEKASSILYGVPVSCIEGIVVGGKLLDDKKKIDFLIQKFPNCYIISSFGEIIYNPSRGEKLDDEIIDLRRKCASLERDKRLSEVILERYEKSNSSLKQDYDNLMRELLLNCRSEDIANVLISLGWQGNVSLQYIDDMRKGYSR